jgi:hypothetical protein
VRNNESGSSPEEPERSGGALRIEVSSKQFEWLTKQCDFLGITKQQLVSEAMEEWVWRNHTIEILRDPSATAQRALNEFMERHWDEFLSDDDF